jgi:flagellin
VIHAGEGVRQVGAEAAIRITDAAINTVSNTRARLGAYQNRLESTVRNLDVAAENTEISRSRIQDTDMARETTKYAQYNVMFQAAMSLLGQANQRPQQIISLLQ